jgi:hypothetical protein
MSAQAFIKPNGCLFMLRKNSHDLGGRRGWRASMQRTWHFPGIPERFMIVVGGFHFNDSGTMP